MGPWVLRQAVRWLHRDTRLVAIEQTQILWNNEEVHLDSPLADISGSPIRDRDNTT
jgi:hypothetical protein